MQLESLVVQTKLTPLRLNKRALGRPRLRQRLYEALDYPLTIIQAGAGYGKSTALAEMDRGEVPVVWYHLDQEDADPLVFLLYMVYGFRRTFPALSEATLAMLESGKAAGTPPPGTLIIDTLINELVESVSDPFFLIIDDAHLINHVPPSMNMLNRLIKHGPSNLHIVLSTRYPLDLKDLATLRVKGNLLEIGEEELAFTPEEIHSLFQSQYNIILNSDEIELLSRETEGWAIALHLIGQGLPHGGREDLPHILERLSGLKEDLFTYLAEEVLDQQEQKIQDFLLITSVLRWINLPLCDALRGDTDSQEILRDLLNLGLFIVELDESNVRYHPLFREFLYHRLSEDQRYAAHLKAAACYLDQGDEEEAVYHYLQVGAFDKAAAILRSIERTMIAAGRLETLANWISSLPPDLLGSEPRLLISLGDIARLRSRFDEALGWYRLAEERWRTQGSTQGIAQALRGQARVYLDTVNPSQAELLLSEALRLSDGQEDRETRANLLELLAENQLNLGHAEKARAFQDQARDLRAQSSDRVELSARVLLRTGRLTEALRMLEERTEAERTEPVLQPRAHREPLLLLSLLQSYLGYAEAAYENALKGTQRGQELNSPFITGVGHMREGHTWLLREDEDKYEKACKCFERTIEISDRISVDRLKVEAYWGLCRAYGLRGEAARARDIAEQALTIAEQAGDVWIMAYLRLAVGAAHVLAGEQNQALDWLSSALISSRECGDTYGETLARLWQCLAWYHAGDSARFEHGIDELLQIVQIQGYEHLFTRRVLAGPPDPRALVPLLIHARSTGRQASFADSLLNEIGLATVEFHPGYRLYIHTLGAFSVRRGQKLVDAGDWQREKARQLFQLLLSSRGTLLDRDKIYGTLWPDLDPEAAARGFKVALNALYSALEPDRRRGASSAYIMRDGSLYGLRPDADLWLDADEFETLIATADQLHTTDIAASVPLYRQALALYQGDYLEEYIYDDWNAEERVRLRSLYLHSADRLAETFAYRQSWQETIDICQQILAHDDCWEHAYRLLMLSYARQGNKAQALRVYQTAVERIRAELDTEPSRETTDLYQQILHESLPEQP